MQQGGQLNTNTLADSVRSWVHFDNLASSLQKQATNARNVRDGYEDKILQTLITNRMEDAIIQIHGGKLSIHEEKHSLPLTFGRLEDMLHSYYNERRLKDLNVPDDTPDIIKFIRKHRDVEVKKKLKKTAAVPPLPPLPPLPQAGPK
jgi:hypothetical protein